jgi:aspartyl/asparaginyl beta-hydroxylase (cupin superfamily)
MTMVLLVTGGIVWFFIGLRLLKGILRRTPLRRALHGPQAMPYLMLLQCRIAGILGSIFRKKTMMAPELISICKATTLGDMTPLRDSLLELDSLPTMKKGLEAVGLQSMFQIQHTPRVNERPSPFTHPMQRPPYYIPGVPAKSFYDPAEFEFTRILEDQYPVIKQELTQLLERHGTGFRGYVNEQAGRLAGWNTFNFFFYGKKYEENCALCPKTTAILESLPRFEKDHIMFSALNPHARIPPHVGPMNGILRAHLGLVVPQGCYIRVGPDERSWQEGKVMVFDDSFEHEVFNHSDAVRIVLFMNFWHPCFSDREVKALERFRAAYELNPVSKLHAENQAAKRAHDLETKGVPAPQAA